MLIKLWPEFVIKQVGRNSEHERKDLLQHFPAIKAKVWSLPRIIGRYSEFMER